MMLDCYFIQSFSDFSPRLWLLSPGQFGAVAGFLGGTGMGGEGRTSTDPDRVGMVGGFLVAVWLFSGSLLSCMTPKTHSYFSTVPKKLDLNHITPQGF